MESRNLSGGKMAMTQPFLDQFWIFLVKMNTKGSPFVPCWFQWNHTASQGEKLPKLSNFLTNFESCWYKWTPKVPLLSLVVLNGITQPLKGENGHNSAISWPILDVFVTNEQQKIPFCTIWFSMESRNLAGGKMAITQPFLDRFWIFLVQMNNKGSPFVPCCSQCNHATFKGGKWL